MMSVATIAGISGQLIYRPSLRTDSVAYEDLPVAPSEIAQSIRMMATPPPDASAYRAVFNTSISHSSESPEPFGHRVSNYLSKIEHFEETHLDDVYLESDQTSVLVRTFGRLDRLQSLVGHGNFNVISFDDMTRYANNHSVVSPFQPDELDFLDQMFHATVARYGFYGEKVTPRMTAIVPEADRFKVPYTGHFLFRGDSMRHYERIRKDAGDTVVLTSGIRSVVKQSYLFLAKTIQSGGNLSRASRSLAPPGHSFHGIGDFDVGKVGLGFKNFTSDFARTEEFRRLVELGYVEMRYPPNNLFGVRYEPWHIKVV
ncbi:MAG: M15 family metallopeptidase [Pseudomonadota bacterium]